MTILAGNKKYYISWVFLVPSKKIINCQDKFWITGSVNKLKLFLYIIMIYSLPEIYCLKILKTNTAIFQNAYLNAAKSEEI